MELSLNLYAEELVTEQLAVFKNLRPSVYDEVIEILKPWRIIEYVKNIGSISLELAFQYFSGTLHETLKPVEVEGWDSFMRGMEFNAYVIEKLENMGVVDIQPEVIILDDITRHRKPFMRKVDVVAFLDGTQSFRVQLPNKKETIKCFPKGRYSFEAKKDKKFKKVKGQVESADAYFKSDNEFVWANVIVPDDINVGEETNNFINKLGGYVIKADITNEGLADRLYDIREKISLLKISNKSMAYIM